MRRVGGKFVTSSINADIGVKFCSAVLHHGVDVTYHVTVVFHERVKIGFIARKSRFDTPG